MAYDCVCDYDPPEFYRQAKSRARKPHKCYECGAPILPGEQYERAMGKWDGSVDTFKTCQHCVALRQWVTNNVPCTCWAHGNLFDDLYESIDEACWRAPKETVGLRFGFARRLHVIRGISKMRRAAANAKS